MASGLSVYYANKVLDKIMISTDFTPNTSYWCAAFNNSGSSVFLRADNLASANEVSGGAYARVLVRAGSSVTWGAASAGTTNNGADIVFPTATLSWGTIYAVALMDASTSGHVVCFGDLATPKPITAPDIFKVPAGFFVVNL